MSETFPKSDLERNFWRFHRANPRIYELFDYFTRQAIDKGHKHLSADMVLHRIRWETSVVTTDREYKITNNHSAYYSRLWMDQNPEWDGFFRKRGVRGDEWDQYLGGNP